MGKKKNTKAPTADDDDDWEAALAEATPTDATPPPAPSSTEEVAAAAAAPVEKELTAAELHLQSLGLLKTDAPAKKDNKKKKKKKGKGGGDDDEASSGKPQSAMAKQIAEKLRKEKEAQDEIDALNKAEEERVAAIEAAEAAAANFAALEKEKKKRKQAEKVAKQKAEGTFMTKAQKAKALKERERLEAMKAAGMNVKLDEDKDDAPKGKVVYDNKKKKKNLEDKKKKGADAEAAKEAAAEAAEAAAKAEELEGVADNWDDDSGEDWDAVSDDGSIDIDIPSKDWSEGDDDSDEDLATADLRKEKERLAALGREREKREEIERKKMEAMRALEAEADMKVLMAKQLIEEGKERREKRERDNLEARSRDNLRCPIIVIMGHVDTGKTKLLDNIRRTNVQEGEAGGITQQIGATYFEQHTLEKRFEKLNEKEKYPFNLPGIQVIDTPGHESFSNLRSRGSNLCDLAILVVDLMHGLEQQTIESLNMLRAKKCPFVVALNKIDRCYDWKECTNDPVRDALAQQTEGTMQEYKSRVENCKMQLQEQGVNSNIYWEMGENDWMSSDFVPLVPTSAISGEGVQDILWLLCKMAQEKMWKQLMYCANLQATVLEVKAIDGLGFTVDVIVVNGVIREGDKIVLCSMDGPVVTEIRGLLTPPPSREMRVKADYQHHKEVKGAMSVKLIGNNFEKVMAGTPLLVVGPDDTEEDICEEVMSDLKNLTTNLQVDKKGVMVQASTLGALEALLQFLRVDTQPPIPVSHVGIGTVTKRDVTGISIMKEKKGCEEYATILAFDVPVANDAKEFAEKEGVKIFTADIIYHLFDHFTRYMEEIAEKRKADAAAIAVFPSIVKILPQHIFNQKDPIIVGMEVVEGILKVGTPLCIPALGGLMVGKVVSIEQNGKVQETARKGASIAVKIVNDSNPTLTYGRQFDATKNLYSFLTRASIDALKANFKDSLEQGDWKLVVKMKKIFNII